MWVVYIFNRGILFFSLVSKRTETSSRTFTLSYTLSSILQHFNAKLNFQTKGNAVNKLRVMIYWCTHLRQHLSYFTLYRAVIWYSKYHFLFLSLNKCFLKLFISAAITNISMELQFAFMMNALTILSRHFICIPNIIICF
jgi:hypothetical protein